MDTPSSKSIAYFITPHGFGHAARSAAVMEALLRWDPAIRFEIYTQVPEWFFADSIPGAYGYRAVRTDIGLVQKSPMEEDLPETLRLLDRFLPFNREMVETLAREVTEKQCRMIICDIAPIGMAVAQAACIPSVLIENFTWDWIYEGYETLQAGFRKAISYLKAISATADIHIQTEPVCMPISCHLTAQPVSRRCRVPARKLRRDLGIPEGVRVVLITLGGIPVQVPFIRRLSQFPDICFVIPGAYDHPVSQGNIRLLPHHSRFFHPDLMHAADAVIGKVGYSTLAEVYDAGIPFGYIARESFRESEPLIAFLKAHMTGRSIGEEGFFSGTWMSALSDLLSRPRISRDGPKGADQVGRFIAGLLTEHPNQIK